jgi:exodeoxyribonuclease VII large subunit
VIASVGHHTDRTLIDDVAAASCSTPTHAAETAVAVDVTQARASTLEAARRLDACGRRAVVGRARHLVALSRAPNQHIARQRLWLHQKTRELRAASGRQLAIRAERTDRHRLVVERKAEAAKHEPQQMLERGYALVEDRAGELVTGADAARRLRELTIRFHDARVRARVDDN